MPNMRKLAGLIDQFNLATQRLNDKLAKMNLENADKQLKKFDEEKTELIMKYQTEIRQLEKSREDRFKTIEDETEKVICSTN